MSVDLDAAGLPNFGVEQGEVLTPTELAPGAPARRGDDVDVTVERPDRLRVRRAYSLSMWEQGDRVTLLTEG